MSVKLGLVQREGGVREYVAEEGICTWQEGNQ